MAKDWKTQKRIEQYLGRRGLIIAFLYYIGNNDISAQNRIVTYAQFKFKMFSRTSSNMTFCLYRLFHETMASWLLPRTIFIGFKKCRKPWMGECLFGLITPFGFVKRAVSKIHFRQIERASRDKSLTMPKSDRQFHEALGTWLHGFRQVLFQQSRKMP